MRAKRRHLTLRFRTQLATLARGFARSPERNIVLWLCLAVFGILVATVVAQVKLNAWNAPFYNAIQRRQVGIFIHELMVFFIIAGSLLVFNVVQMWLNLMIQLKLRAALMHDLLDLWLEPMRAFRLASSGILGVNPDQRLHEDTRHLTELTTSLAIGLVQATMLLVVFVVVLWTLSDEFVFHANGRTFGIPGYMVWAALIYALIGSLTSFKVGYSLIRSNAERYSREAELRSTLVRVSDHIGTIALHRGEGSERRLLEVDLKHVLEAMRAIVVGTTRLTWVTAGSGWLTQVVPIIVAAPVYFSGEITFGKLMMAVGAFNQVQSSLQWFVANFASIADWRATLLRVADFRVAAIKCTMLNDINGKILVVRGEPGQLIFDGLAVASDGDCTRLDEPRVVIKAGERLQITGDSGDAQTIFFRAIAGLWPWGEGRIILPSEEPFMHIGRRPYVRAGKLRDVLAYPHDPDGIDDARFRSALEAVGLTAFQNRLDEVARWDVDLGDQDQQRIVFARLALQKPAWIVIDQALETLDQETLEQVMTLLTTSLGDASVINIGRAERDGDVFSRTYTLIEDPDGCRLAETPHEDELTIEIAPAEPVEALL